MQASGELVKKNIIVNKPRDIGRFFNKSQFGETISGNKLQLNLLEGVFLVGEKKITVFCNKKIVGFRKLVKLAAKHISHFEIKYMIYRDLRKRGYAVNLYENKGFDFSINDHRKNEGKNKESYFISSFTERDIFDIEKTRALIEKTKEKKSGLWFAIVDEEGDLTYYDVSISDVKGKTKEHVFSKTIGCLLENRIVIFNEKIAGDLHVKEFFGKPFGNGLQLSLAEAWYLLERKTIDIEDINGKNLSKNEFISFVEQLQPDIEQRVLVFKDLKKRGLIVKTGFKFGAHFRAYTKKPDETHAEYLVHVVKKGFTSTWSEISRAVRLAHSVNKEIIFARIDKKNVDYVKLGRLRP